LLCTQAPHTTPVSVIRISYVSVTMRFPLPLVLLAAGLFAALPAAGSAQGYAFVEFSSQFDACNKASSDDKAAAITSAENALARLPHPLPHVHTEGTLPHQGIRDQSVAAERDWTAARDLAVGFCVTRREDFRVRALTFLSAWLTTYHPDFNPIDETNLDNLFLAEDLVGQGFTPDLTARWQDFSRAIAQNYLKQIDERASKDAGNWQSHRIKLATLAAYSLNDSNLIAHAQTAFTNHLARNINPDGSVYDYGQRDALHYVVYDLEPLLTAALAARAHSTNWYNLSDSTGSTLSGALLWLAPYARDGKPHEEFVHSSVAFDNARRQAGEAGFSGQWNPGTSANLYLYATALDPKWADVVSKLNARPALWQQLIMGMPDATSIIQR
jgi:hypothetical protein